MDPLSHGLVGAAAARLITRGNPKVAMGAGFLAALLPDVDVFLRRENDPIYQLEFHRQFTHALSFIPVGALLASGLLWIFLRSKAGFRDIFVACLGGYATAGLLDACTSYGTQLLWPFSSYRVAWNLTPVVEPLITLGLLVLMGVCWKTQRVRWSWLAVGWLAILLSHGAYRQHQALKTAKENWLARGHVAQKFVVKPTLGNQFLWRVTYISGQTVYTDGVRTRPFTRPLLVEGESARLVSLEGDFGIVKGTDLYASLERFERLSEGFLIYHPEEPEVVGDARYSMLPTRLEPLWGLEFDIREPSRPVRFRTFRDSDKRVVREFLDMF